MRIPVSWLADHVALPEGTTPEQIADAFVRVGLEVEEVHHLAGVTGPLVAGLVMEIEELTDFKKPIRYCKVDVGNLEEDGETVKPQMIICGARNFREGDTIVAALPGCVLPGGFAISERKTYGRMSQGMICSVAELALGEDHSGILVLPSGTAQPGDDAKELLGLDDAVIELAVTPDRGYCLSARGLARELACAFDADYRDPAMIDVGEADDAVYPVHVEDLEGCRRFVLRRVTGLDPTSPTPWWMRRRLMLAGIRPISLAVDVTNYVMLETGHPLHAFDTTTLRGSLVVRRANAGEKLSTLDGASRELDPDDLIICDDSGPISLAGVMGGASTEITDSTTDVLLEAANWEPATIARVARRHKLPSEASRRFERLVDPALPPAALELAAQLLSRYGDARIERGRTDVGRPLLPAAIAIPLALPDRVAGVNYGRGVTARRLSQIGCRIEVGSSDDGTAVVVADPPTWRGDLNLPADLVEEVLRLEGYHTIPSVLPPAPAGRGLTAAQRRRRTVSRALAATGHVEVLPMPFVSPQTWDAFGLAEDDPRRRTVSLLNPLEAERPELAGTLLPGLFDAVQRNVSRGMRDLALYQVGQVVQPDERQVPAPDLPVDRRPTDAELATLLAALPKQPLHVAAVFTGQRERAGWWGKGRAANWSDAVEAARTVARAAGVELTVTAGELAPWHPGRCAALRIGDAVVGHAGELHPKVVEALGLPARTCAMELDLDGLPLTDERPSPVVSPYPPVLLDVALVADATVPVADVTDAIVAGGGDLVEDVRLFDVYTGEQVGEGKRSLAFSLRLRAPDRTLTVEEATEARDAAVALAAERTGAALRG
ncbi:phenylalanine--tRNA ligase subunit beta [Allokutzneria sp. A3M-2-11 16]|uniref:phenylalanine--tRNA ligase subunit beta n=1 Tax=Allokutzneria sp. A3M-2-11 16 TaxID=2962043 RepID=UPI0020B732F8|nr:phenylalanine--tRNA ligase subunit beta [Allokutzneria sp. A3M-2-11 16]MCP3804239.1 phenylalanine--tRNA ligase subunit beta [Allokutzneria sp. A3M-2-11 16]